MRVLFIYPNLYSQLGFNIGLATLSACLKRDGHETKLIHWNERLSPPKKEELFTLIDTYKPDLIGFSIVFTQWQFAQDIARSIKEKYTIPLLAGGINVTLNPETILQSGLFDYAALGENEYVITALANKLTHHEDTTSIPGIWAFQQGTSFKNPLAPFPNIHDLPRKDYALFNFQELIDKEQGWVRLMASRGCPQRCTYCFNHTIVDTYKKSHHLPTSQLGYLRQHTVQEVLDEITYLLTNYKNITTFIFDDDIFTLNKQFVLDFAKAYPTLTTIPFVINSHVDYFDGEIAHALKQAGCKMVKFGVESGNEQIRRTILARYMTNEKIIDAFRYAHEAGLETSAFIMIGIPHEGENEIMDTLRLLATIKPSRFRWTAFFPFPGMQAYTIARDAGLLDEEKMHHLTNFTDDSCLDFGPTHNLLLNKMLSILPWYINALLSPASPYALTIQHVLRMTEHEWEDYKKTIPTADARLTEKTKEEHYAMQFNRFTSVKINPAKKVMAQAYAQKS